MTKIKRRDRDTIIQSLRAGVVPKRGLQHVQVGRVNEVKALLKNIDSITMGGSFFKLIIGEYGSGKTFFIQLVRTVAFEKGVVTLHADLSPVRRLQASGGQARNLYSELMHNLSTRTKPDGNALSSVVEKFITVSRKEADLAGKPVEDILSNKLNSLSEYVGGYDFAKVIAAYWEGYNSGNDTLKQDAVQWLRGEYSTKTEARKNLDVRSIIDDHSIYDHLKLMSLFVKLAGYNGLLVCLDELVNLYKLSNTQARNTNYEQILRILNDSLQGGAENIGFLLGGTPEFLFDPRKGLYSYEALQSRLSENTFAKSQGIIDYNSPALHMTNLSQEDLLILLRKLRTIFNSDVDEPVEIPDEALESFMSHCFDKIGDSYFKTPRNTIKAFLDLMDVLQQNKDLKWTDMLERVEIKKDNPTDIIAGNMEDSLPETSEDENWSSFKL